MNFSNITTIVFDLDGTLYEDTHHFGYNTARIKEFLPTELQPKFQKDYEQVLANNHALTIGRVYDLEKDLILVQIEGAVKEAYQWDGTPLSSEEQLAFYSEPITIDMERFFSIGDLWWVPNAIGRHYGVTGEETYKAFLQTREYMMTPDFVMNPVPDFKETLESIQDKVNLVLLTNSPQTDSEVLIHKLGLSEVFSLKVFNGKKPNLTNQRFAEIAQHFNVDYSAMLSIGDNWINEILPARKLGCKTIFIDSHETCGPDSADLVVKSVGEVIPYLKSFR